MFFKKKGVKNQAKKFDKLITWLIIGWAVASMVWISKTSRWKKITNNFKNLWKNIFWKWHMIFWKMTLKVLNIFSKKK
jgi:hypothetical protein